MGTVYYIEDIYDERLDKNALADILYCFRREEESILFSYKFWFLTPDEISFLYERTVFETNHIIWAEEALTSSYKTKWFEVKSKEEINWVLEKVMLFECLIHSKKGGIDQYTYALYVQENINGYSLVIHEKNKGEFENTILPKIQHHLSDILNWGQE